MNLQLIKPNPINKIVVVGHPLSGYQEVETLLNISGMNPPEPSRRDGFLPAEISATLSKAHRTPIFNALHPSAEIKQIDVGPIWNGMALDLLLGNIDQEFWGWADSQSVYLLDYWKSLDPQLAFVLVYDTPEQLVAQAFDAQTPLTPEALQQATDNWSAYNAALLHFYHRNPERCLLVHAQQVRESSSAYLQQMRTRIGAPVLTVDTEIDETDTDSDEITVVAPPHAAAPQAALKAYIAHALIQQHTMQLYEELQSVANLPLAEHVAAPYTPLDAWISMTAQQTQHTKQATKAQAHAQAQQVQIQALSQSLNGAEALAGERQQHVARLEQTQTIAQQRTQEQQQENELILLQLHQVQEELERHYLEGQQQQEKIKALQEIEKLASERAKDIEQLSQDKAKLATEKDSQAKLAKERASQIEQINKQLATQTQLAQAQAAQIKETAAKPPVVNLELTQENDLLLLQLHQVQEELERYYLENQQLKQKPAAPAKPPKPTQYGAAERIKSELSYRLGAAMIAQSRSFTGWLAMPWALSKKVREFRREEITQGDTLLPPIKNYTDAHEAERVKQHLSYRLGAAMVANAHTPLGWMKMPWMLRRAALDFKQTRSMQ